MIRTETIGDATLYLGERFKPVVACRACDTTLKHGPLPFRVVWGGSDGLA